jgi:hypothetical protein
MFAHLRPVHTAAALPATRNRVGRRQFIACQQDAAPDPRQMAPEPELRSGEEQATTPGTRVACVLLACRVPKKTNPAEWPRRGLDPLQSPGEERARRSNSLNSPDGPRFHGRRQFSLLRRSSRARGVEPWIPALASLRSAGMPENKPRLSCPRKRASSTHRRRGGAPIRPDGAAFTGFRLSPRCARSAGMMENVRRAAAFDAR